MDLVLLIDGNAPDPADLTVVSGTIDEGINQVYLIDLVMACSKWDLMPQDQVGRKLTLKLQPKTPPDSNQKVSRFDGLIMEFDKLGEPWHIQGLYGYRARVKPAVCKLGYKMRSQIFAKKKRPEIASAVLSDNGLSKGTDFEVNLINASAYPEEEQVVQFQSTDLDFLARQLASQGINFFFVADTKGDKVEKLVLADDPSFFPRMEEGVQFVPDTGQITDRHSIFSFTAKAGVVPGSVKLEQYSPAKPSQKFQAERKVKDGMPGQVQLYGNPGPSQDDTTRLAKTRGEELAVDLWGGEGESNIFLLRSGQKISLPSNIAPPGNYLFTRIHHRFSQQPEYISSQGNKGLDYRNRFSVAKAEGYRPDYMGLRSITR